LAYFEAWFHFACFKGPSVFETVIQHLCFSKVVTPPADWSLALTPG
jgi:hypothetical protein